MKIIGMELRVGVGGGERMLEAKLVPVEIIIPNWGGQRNGPEAEVTFHCDIGDVTTPRIMLPFGYPGVGRGYVSQCDATEQLRQHLNRLHV